MWGESETIYLSLHCHHHNDSCFKMGSDEGRQSHKTVSTNNLLEEKGEQTRYRTEVLPLTGLTPYRWATPAHVWRWEKREMIYLPLRCHLQNDSCIQMGSGESPFNVSLNVKDKVTRQCPQTPGGT